MSVFDLIKTYPSKFKEIFTYLILLVGIGLGFGARTLMTSDFLNNLNEREKNINDKEIKIINSIKLKDTIRIKDTVLISNDKIKNNKSANKMKLNSILLTVQLISLEYAKFQSDSLIAELKFINNSEKNCYISNNISHHMFFQPQNSTFNFAAIDTYTHQRFTEFLIEKHSEINKSCLFNLKPLINDNIKRQESDYPVSDTCKIGVWAHCLGENDTGNTINDIVIFSQNGKIINKEITRSKKPIVIINK
jgi:hypothetical protein